MHVNTWLEGRYGGFHGKAHCSERLLAQVSKRLASQSSIGEKESGNQGNLPGESQERGPSSTGGHAEVAGNCAAAQPLVDRCQVDRSPAIDPHDIADIQTAPQDLRDTLLLLCATIGKLKLALRDGISVEKAIETGGGVLVVGSEVGQQVLVNIAAVHRMPTI